MNKCIVVFSGYNQRAVLAFLRTLEANRLPYTIIAKSNSDSIFQTDYKNKVGYVRKSIPLVLDDLLNSVDIIKKEIEADEYVIAPSTEALNRFLLQNRTEFENRGFVVPIVKEDLYQLISNKQSFGILCNENNIIIPDEVDFGDNFICPCVAKPKKYFSAFTGEILSPIIIQNSFDFNAFVEKYSTKDFYLQEFVKGESYYLLYYFHRNGKIFKYSQKNLVQQPEGKSIIAAASSNFHHSSESNKYELLFKSLNFFGFIMVEIKKQGDKNYMIEANPRFWGPSQLFVDGDMNFFEAFHDFGVLKYYQNFLNKIKKLNISGLAVLLKP